MAYINYDDEDRMFYAGDSFDRGSLSAMSCALTADAACVNTVSCCDGLSDITSVSAQGTASSNYSTANKKTTLGTIDMGRCFTDVVSGSTTIQDSIENITEALKKLTQRVDDMSRSNSFKTSILKSRIKRSDFKTLAASR